MTLVSTAGDLGKLVRERRRALGLSQGELAKRVGVSRQWIVEVERGKERAEIGLVLRVLSTLDLHVRVEPRSRGPVDIDALIERARGRS